MIKAIASSPCTPNSHSLAPNLPQANPSLLVRHSQHGPSHPQRNRRDPSKRRITRRPVPVHRAAGQMHQTERIALPPARHDEHVARRVEDEMADGRGELVQDADGRGPFGDPASPILTIASAIAIARIGFRPGACAAPPPGPVVDVHDTAGAADDAPPIAAEAHRAFPRAAQRHDRDADGALVDPPRDDPPVAQIVFHRFATFAENAQALPVAPPVEVGHAAAALDAHLGDPLACVRVEDVHGAAALAGAADEGHVGAVRGEFEALHGALFVGVAVDAGDFLDGAGCEVPDVEVAAAGGEEDAGFRGGRWCGGECVRGAVCSRERGGNGTEGGCRKRSATDVESR